MKNIFLFLIPIIFFLSCKDSRIISTDYSKETFVAINNSKFTLDSLKLSFNDSYYILKETVEFLDSSNYQEIVFYDLNPFKIEIEAFLENNILVQDSFNFNCSWCSGINYLEIYQDSISYFYHP